MWRMQSGMVSCIKQKKSRRIRQQVGYPAQVDGASYHGRQDCTDPKGRSNGPGCQNSGPYKCGWHRCGYGSNHYASVDLCIKCSNSSLNWSMAQWHLEKIQRCIN